MTRPYALSRRDLLHGIFSPPGAPENAALGERASWIYPPEPAENTVLPPEFSGSMLRAEVVRLGRDPATMSENDMAALVIKAMHATAEQTAPRQRTSDEHGGKRYGGAGHQGVVRNSGTRRTKTRGLWHRPGGRGGAG